MPAATSPSPWRALRPRYWPFHLLGIVAVAIAVGLGLWQLDAWQRHREAAAQDLTSRAAVPLADVMGPDDPFPGNRVGQRVEVGGTWVPDGTFLVSGREHDGRDGYWVVTPLAVGDGEQAPAVEIVRGWTPSADGVPPPPSGPTTLTAWLQPPEGESGTPDPRADVYPQLSIAAAIQLVDRDLYSAFGVLDESRPATNPGSTGLVQASLQQLPDAGSFTAIRNLLYAVEWWFFGLFAAYIWWRWLREDVLTEYTAQPGSESETGPTTAPSVS